MMDKSHSLKKMMINGARGSKKSRKFSSDHGKTEKKNDSTGSGSNLDEYSIAWEKVLQMNEMELEQHPISISYECAAVKQYQNGKPNDMKLNSWAAVIKVDDKPNQMIGTFNSKIEALRRATSVAIIMHDNKSKTGGINPTESLSIPPMSSLSSVKASSSLLYPLSSSQLQTDVVREKSDSTHYEITNANKGNRNDQKSSSNLKSYLEPNQVEVSQCELTCPPGYSGPNALVASGDHCDQSNSGTYITKPICNENGHRDINTYFDLIRSNNINLNDRNKTAEGTQKIAFGNQHDGLKVKCFDQQKGTHEILRKGYVKEITKKSGSVRDSNNDNNCKIQQNNDERMQECPQNESDEQIKLSARNVKTTKSTVLMTAPCSTNELSALITKKTRISTLSKALQPDSTSHPDITLKTATIESETSLPTLSSRRQPPLEVAQNLEFRKSNKAEEEKQLLKDSRSDSLKLEISKKSSKIQLNTKSKSTSFMIDEDTNQNSDECFAQSQDLDNLLPNSNPLEMSDSKTQKVLDIFFSCYQAQRETGISRYMLGQACKLGGGIIQNKYFRYLSKKEFKQLVNPSDDSISYVGYSIHKSAQFKHILTHVLPRSKITPLKDLAKNQTNDQALQSFTTKKKTEDKLENTSLSYEKNGEGDVTCEGKSLKRKYSGEQIKNATVSKKTKNSDLEDGGFNSLIIKPLNPKRYTKRVKKYVELVENKTNKVIICFRGNLDAGLALDLDRKKVGRACQSYGAPFEIKFRGFHLRYKSTGLKMEAYEYGKHKEDFMHVDETHEERLARWQKTFERDQLNCPQYKRENAMREEKRRSEQNEDNKVEDSNDTTDLTRQNTNGVSSEDECDDNSQQQDACDDRSHKNEKSDNITPQQGKADDISQQNDESDDVSQKQHKCHDGSEKMVSSIDSTVNLPDDANEDVGFESKAKGVKICEKKLMNNETKISEQTVSNRHHMEMESDEIPISNLMKEGAYEHTSISSNLHPCTPVILRKICARNENDLLCVVCQKQKAKIIFLPCNHCVICAACNDENVCPIFCPSCRMPIDRRLETHIATHVRPRIYSAYSFI